MRKKKTVRGISTRRRSEKTPTPQERAGALEQRIAELTTEVDELTKQITQYHIAGQGDLEKLTRDRRNADEALADAKRALPLLRERIEKDTQMLARVKAADRIVGISRARGSLVRQLDADGERCLGTAAKYQHAVETMNGRFKSIGVLDAEASALQDRFGIPIDQPTPVVPPALREGCGYAAGYVNIEYVDHGHRAPSTEEHAESGPRRRDYLEISGTPAFEIIQMVGLKDFPPISAAVQAARSREKRQEREFTDRMAGAVDPTKAPPLPEHVR